MNRRDFLQLLGITAIAPVAYSALQFVAPQIFRLYGDGITDDTEAFHALINGHPVIMPDGRTQQGGVIYFPAGRYKLTERMEP